MKTIIIFALFLSASSLVRAQDKPQFSSQNYLGIMEGESGTALQLQSINGFRYKTWFAGIGAGLDYYFQRSVPVFFSASKFINSKKLPLYFTADIGINFPWSRSNIYYFEYPGEYHAGFYGAGGVGYKFGFKKSSNALLLNLGYSYKHLTQTYERPVMCLVPPCPDYYEKYDYRLRRLSVRIGWMF